MRPIYDAKLRGEIPKRMSPRSKNPVLAASRIDLKEQFAIYYNNDFSRLLFLLLFEQQSRTNPTHQKSGWFIT
jgi:hypothetical protein